VAVFVLKRPGVVIKGAKAAIFLGKNFHALATDITAGIDRQGR
jgi:hypothetical protein